MFKFWFAVAALAIPSFAQATTYTLSGTYTDGRTLAGSFDYRPQDGYFSNFNVTVTQNLAFTIPNQAPPVGIIGSNDDAVVLATSNLIFELDGPPGTLTRVSGGDVTIGGSTIQLSRATLANSGGSNLYTLSGTYTDGRTLAGSFDYRPQDGYFSNFNVTVTQNLAFTIPNQAPPVGIIGSNDDAVVLATSNLIFELDGPPGTLTRVSGGDVTIGGSTIQLSRATVAAIPEPADWTLMVVGFGFVGASIRRRKQGGAVGLSRTRLRTMQVGL